MKTKLKWIIDGGIATTSIGNGVLTAKVSLQPGTESDFEIEVNSATKHVNRNLHGMVDAMFYCEGVLLRHSKNISRDASLIGGNQPMEKQCPHEDQTCYDCPRFADDCDGKDTLQKTYITFGDNHTHEINGQIFDGDCVAVIENVTPAQGRARAFELFGPVFSFEYPEKNFDHASMHYFKRGFVVVAP
jgi:hypothetical protein